MNSRKSVSACSGCLWYLAPGRLRYSQESSASLNGTVRDITGAVIPGAHITLRNTKSGVEQTTRQVDELPLNGRQFTQLLALTPGASPANVSQNSGGGQSNALGAVVIPAVDVQQNRTNYFALDGINDSEVVFSSFAVSPIVDDIQEFKVQSHNDEAQFVYVTGGIVNVVTKSGTNTYHGALWEFLRNDALDARNAFDFAPQKVSLRQNQFGANVGGPVIIPHFYNGKNKTFLFGSYEGFRNVTGAGLEGLAITPTQAQLSGDLSSYRLQSLTLLLPERIPLIQGNLRAIRSQVTKFRPAYSTPTCSNLRRTFSTCWTGHLQSRGAAVNSSSIVFTFTFPCLSWKTKMV